MTDIVLIFPDQLFRQHPASQAQKRPVVLVEDSLYFGDAEYPLRFHKQKLAYHRATMAGFAAELESSGYTVSVERYQSPHNQLPALCQRLAANGVTTIHTAELNDFWLSRRLHRATGEYQLTLEEHPSPGFINQTHENEQWRQGRKRWFMADFYRWQRQRLNVLMEGDDPVGGRWSFDEDNRKKLPRQEIARLPELPVVAAGAEVKAAIDSVNTQFPDNPGSLDRWWYPHTSTEAEHWLDDFLQQRFEKFGPYEDAIVAGHRWLHHGVLTPMLNVGLLTPAQILQRALEVAAEKSIPLNSVEGFVRQVIGWREFMRATYHDLSIPMRTTNHWQHHRAMPASFYTGTTGIDPVDDVILRVLDTGYCHHIERLMVLGGFMFLCEIDPDEIYRWFMEMFIDSYDWVMVPNVYAMSQHADGGAITTKPYFSGSNYILKMSNFKRGEWSDIWDALFWRWIINHGEQLRANPRWAVMVRNAEKMDALRKRQHLDIAEQYLISLG